MSRNFRIPDPKLGPTASRFLILLEAVVCSLSFDCTLPQTNLCYGNCAWCATQLFPSFCPHQSSKRLDEARTQSVSLAVQTSAIVKMALFSLFDIRQIENAFYCFFMSSLICSINPPSRKFHSISREKYAHVPCFSVMSLWWW